MPSIEIPTSNNISTPGVDTSSYRLALPANQNNALGTAQQLGGLQQQKIQVDRQKLELMNDRFKIINNELSTLANDPTASREKILTKMNTLSKMGLVPKEQLAEFEKDVPQDPKQIPQFLEQTLQRGMSVMEHINFQYGQPGSVDTGQATIPTVTSPRFGVRATNAPIQRQLPPGTPVVNPETGQPAALGAQPYQGAPKVVHLWLSSCATDRAGCTSRACSACCSCDASSSTSRRLAYGAGSATGLRQTDCQ